ncbi:MAG TPA: HEAT repeat domain-containing protein [Thermoguttaceae bacterium]|nr:HEAT repeat domain-containing protein [Thermoguttaceae bacterium]
MKGRRTLRLTLGITAGLVVLAVAGWSLYPRFLAAYWGNRLQTVPDERAAVLLEGVARLGEPGIPVLVDALGSERESVAAAGKRVVYKELERWGTLRAREYSPKLAILAKALADRVARFGPTAREDAADLASQILRLWALDDEVVEPAEVIASCEKVLRAAGAERSLLAERSRPDGPGDSRPGLRTAGDRGPEVGALLQDLVALPGGGLPIDALASPGVTPDRSDAPRLAESPPAEPRRLDPRGASSPLRQPLRPISEPDGLLAIPDRAARRSDDTEGTDQPEVRPLAFLNGVPVPADDRAGGRGALRRLAGLETVDLMRRLQSPRDETVAEAQAELVRRGFTERHLALARRLFDPDPEVRVRLARLLMDLPDVSAAPWLLQLARDESAEVRLSAISLLATTGDPALTEAIEAIAREDPDPRVQDQAERIAQRRRTARY